MPTVVAILGDEDAISLVENSEESETSKELKEVKFDCIIPQFTFSALLFHAKKSKIDSNNCLDFDSIPSKIFLTPPELV